MQCCCRQKKRGGGAVDQLWTCLPERWHPIRAEDAAGGHCGVSRRPSWPWEGRAGGRCMERRSILPLTGPGTLCLLNDSVSVSRHDLVKEHDGVKAREETEMTQISQSTFYGEAYKEIFAGICTRGSTADPGRVCSVVAWAGRKLLCRGGGMARKHICPTPAPSRADHFDYTYVGENFSLKKTFPGQNLVATSVLTQNKGPGTEAHFWNPPTLLRRAPMPSPRPAKQFSGLPENQKQHDKLMSTWSAHGRVCVCI